MSDPEPLIPEMREMRAELVSAARREGVRRRRRWRGIGATAIVGTAVIAGGAAASRLISEGDPVESPRQPSIYQPGSAKPVLALTTADRAVNGTWAVQIYDAAGGRRCAIAGQLRGRTLGVVTSGRFHRYSNQTSGECSPAGRDREIIGRRQFATSPMRTLIYGRAKPGSRGVELTIRGKRPLLAAAGPGASYLFVFEGDVPLADIRAVRGLSRRPVRGSTTPAP